MNEELIEEQNLNQHPQPLLHDQLQNYLDYGAFNDPREIQEEAKSQMGGSVLFADLQNQNNQDRAREIQKDFRQKIIVIGSFLIILFSITLLIHKVGINKNTPTKYQDDGLCGIDLQKWYVTYTSAVAFKLLLTIGRYYFFKRTRQENLSLYFSDLLLINLLMTAIFLKGNFLYFSSKNYCYYTNDTLVRNFYVLFCGLTIFGYLQFVWCILLSCFLPLSAFLIYQLVEHRLQQNGGDGTNNIFNDGLIGGLMQVPLPVPDILNQLQRTKFNQQKYGQLQSQCAICWADFVANDEVTPLICDERHLYHTKCIEAWIRKGHNTCPLCRKQIANLNAI